MAVDWKAEKKNIEKLGREGYTGTDMAKMYGVTRQRMQQILVKFFGEFYKYHFNHDENGKTIITKEQLDILNGMREKLKRKKQNLRRMGQFCDLNFEDFDWPLKCPETGIELDWIYSDRIRDNSPCFMRVDPALGWVKDNVRIVSMKYFYKKC